MLKQITTGFVLMASVFAFNQVGIGTDNPQATLDVEGNPSNVSLMDGIIAPRLTGEQLGDKTYGSNQTGALVYVTAADPTPAGQTIDVTATGYYYFNGTKWVTAGGSNANIYNADGTLTSNRILTQDGKTLRFNNGTGQSTQFFNNDGIGFIQRPGSTGRASLGFYDSSGVADFWIFADSNAPIQFTAVNNATALVMGTTSNVNPARFDFITGPGSSAPGLTRAQIHGDGRFAIYNTLSIGWASQQSFSGDQKLKVNGSIVTAGAVYPDYVFEDYFNGASALNSSYKSTGIYETERFIKENHHLPGVTPLTALEKTEEGKYMINLSELSVQSLEKIEELYLYTIEQQKQIDDQQKQINALNKSIQNLQEKIEAIK